MRTAMSWAARDVGGDDLQGAAVAVEAELDVLGLEGVAALALGAFPAVAAVEGVVGGVEAGGGDGVASHVLQGEAEEPADEAAPAVLRPADDGADAAMEEGAAVDPARRRYRADVGDDAAVDEGSQGPLRRQHGAETLDALRRRLVVEGGRLEVDGLLDIVGGEVAIFGFHASWPDEGWLIW